MLKENFKLIDLFIILLQLHNHIKLLQEGYDSILEYN